RIDDPTAILLSDSILRILHHKPSVGQLARIVFVTAAHCFPIGWLELKPIRPAGSEMLTFVGRTTEDLGLFQIEVERTDFGGRIAKSVGGSRLFAPDGIIHQLRGS